MAFLEAEPKEMFGDLVMVQSNQQTDRQFVHVSQLSAKYAGQDVWLRTRVHNTRAKGNNCFVIMRSMGYTVQGAMFKSETCSKEMIKFAGALSKETVVDVKGKVLKAEVKSCSQGDVEIALERIYVISKADVGLPLQIDDAGRSEEEIAESEKRHAAGEVDGRHVRVRGEAPRAPLDRLEARPLLAELPRRRPGRRGRLGRRLARRRRRRRRWRGVVRGQRRDVGFDVALRVDLLEALGAALVLDRLPRAGRAVRRAAAREGHAGFFGA